MVLKLNAEFKNNSLKILWKCKKESTSKIPDFSTKIGDE